MAKEKQTFSSFSFLPHRPSRSLLLFFPVVVMSVPQVSRNELNISESVGRAQLPPERTECRALFERRAAPEVTEEALLSTRTWNHQGTAVTSNIWPPSWIVISLKSPQVVGVFQTFGNGRLPLAFVECVKQAPALMFLTSLTSVESIMAAHWRKSGDTSRCHKMFRGLTRLNKNLSEWAVLSTANNMMSQLNWPTQPKHHKPWAPGHISMLAASLSILVEAFCQKDHPKTTSNLLSWC